MDYYVKKQADSLENPSSGKVFSTIQQAADAALPGDTVWIGEGVYREWVRPRRGGSDSLHPITYRNIPGERAVISGAEEIADWAPCGNDIWKALLPAALSWKRRTADCPWPMRTAPCRCIFAIISTSAGPDPTRRKQVRWRRILQ